MARLLAKDDGWLAAYFDTLSRLTPAQQVYFTDEHRLPRFYEALRGKDVGAGPARPVFRPDPDLLLLVTRLELDASGQPMVPGNLQVWEQILRLKTDSKVVRQWAKRANHWKNPDQLVEALFAFSRQSSAEGPLQIYLMLSAIDGARPPERRLSPQTVLLLAQNFARYGNQYLTFSEFGDLNDDSIARFLQVAGVIDRVSNVTLAGQCAGHLSGQRRPVANPGAARSDLRRQFESVLAGGDRSFRGRSPPRPNSSTQPGPRYGNCGGPPQAVPIFPMTKWSPCLPVRVS